jgi:hypothetical protein
MEHVINLDEQAFRAYQRRAQMLGLSVEEYLNRSAPIDDDFLLTPEMRASIERALAQADAGHLVSLDLVREGLALYRKQCLEGKSH